MLYREAIQREFLKNKKNYEIARKIYLSFPTYAFKHKKDDEFNIKNEISQFFKIPFRNIQIVGSAKTGESYIKGTKFDSETSDLDVAIIDLNLFFEYLEIVFKKTKGYKILTIFSEPNDQITYERYIAKGIFRPEFMPNCWEKTRLRKFFNYLSSKYIKDFTEINIAIYASECFFESKQGSSIKKIRIAKLKC